MSLDMGPLLIGKGAKPLRVEVPVIAAPMAGVLDPSYRAVLHERGCPLSFTEMISSRGLVNGQFATEVLLGPIPSEGLSGVQIFGSDPEVMAKAARILSGKGFHLIDINAGCPKRKVHAQGAGGALLKDQELLLSIAKSVVDSTDLPVGVKLRSGWAESDVRTLGDLIEGLTAVGLSWITIHPRTVLQNFSGEADPAVLGSIRDRTDLPMIASGDIRTPKDIEMYLAEGADGFMVGRTLMGDPNWFLRFKRFREIGVWPDPVREVNEMISRLLVAREHLLRMVRNLGEERGVRDFRPHLSWYLKGVKGRSVLQSKVFSISTLDEAFSVIDEAIRMARSSDTFL